MHHPVDFVQITHAKKLHGLGHNKCVLLSRLFWCVILSQGKRSYLDAIHARYEVHGTVYKEKTKKLMHVPDYVVNHGILSGLDLHELLQRTKVGGDGEWERVAWKERGNIGWGARWKNYLCIQEICKGLMN